MFFVAGVEVLLHTPATAGTGTDLRELDLTSIRSLLREHAAIVPAFR
jgi:hypothetical protein